MSTVQKLEALQPTDMTIRNSVELEELSVNQLKSMVSNNTLDASVGLMLIKVLNTVAKMRINQRAEISIKANIIKDVSADKEEMKMYIEATFPKAFRKTNKS